MQITLAVGVALILITAAACAVPDLRLTRLHPFTPHGLTGVGRAVVILFFAFAGWEAITHLSGEFRNVQRDLRYATRITITVVVTLYLTTAAAVVLTGTYGDPHTDGLAIGLMVQHTLGVGAAMAAAVAALIISLGTTNAFIASVSRLGYALSRDGWMPGPLERISSRQVPSTSIAVVGSIGAGGLLLAWLQRWGTQNIVAIPSTLVIVTYLVGMSSGVKLLSGRERGVAALALALTVCTVPFALTHALVPVGVAAAAIAYRHHRSPTRAPAAVRRCAR
jgi:amino acid efflux transporter